MPTRVRTALLSALLLVAAAFLAGPSRAATVAHVVDVTFLGASADGGCVFAGDFVCVEDWFVDWQAELPQFDPSLGDLVMATLDASVSFALDQTYTGQASTSQVAPDLDGIFASHCVGVAPGATCVADYEAPAAPSYFVAPASSNAPNPTPFASLIGTGTTLFDFYSEHTHHWGYQLESTASVTGGTGSLLLTYEYTPVPEPATGVLLVAAVALAGATAKPGRGHRHTD